MGFGVVCGAGSADTGAAMNAAKANPKAMVSGTDRNFIIKASRLC